MHGKNPFFTILLENIQKLEYNFYKTVLNVKKIMFKLY